MRWFKHISLSHDDEILSELMDNFGAEGYGVWWLILEKIAQSMDETERTSARYSLKVWANFARVSPKKFQKLVEFLKSREVFSLKIDGGYLTIDCPKLLKYRDEYTKKEGRKQPKTPDKLRTKSGQTPEQEAEAEAEAEADTETETDISSNSNIPNVETRAREPSAAAAAENVVSDPPDKPPREIYLEELGKSFPQIGVHGRVNGKVLQMLMSWERASVIADDIREAIQHVQSRGDPVQTPVYYREIVLSFASDRQRSAHDPPSPRSGTVVGFSQGLGGQYAGSSSSRSIMDEVHAARLEAEREYSARFGKLELGAG